MEERARTGTRFDAIVRALLAIALVAVVAALFFSGVHRELDASSIHARVRALGPFGPLAFVLAFALIQPLGPSGHLFTIAAGLLWPTPIAFALGLAGAVAAQTLGFVFYRYVAYAWARERIPSWLARYEDALVARPFRSVFVLRLVAFTWAIVPALLGVSRVRFAPMFFATVLGLCPGVLVGVLFGESVFARLFSELARLFSAS